MIASFSHVPSAACGAWPSFFTINDHAKLFYVELNLCEGVNLAERNQMTYWFDAEAGCRSLSVADTSLNPSLTKRSSVSRAYWTDAAGTFGTDVNENGGVIFAMAIENEKHPHLAIHATKRSRTYQQRLAELELLATSSGELQQHHGGWL